MKNQKDMTDAFEAYLFRLLGDVVTKQTINHIKVTHEIYLQSAIHKTEERMIEDLEHNLCDCICDGKTICDYHNGAGKLLVIRKEDWNKLVKNHSKQG